ncbi:hypothetical protein PRIPAC_78246 [Pristionchus pacificus]|uniref:G protein-coupled receptor n=1 Tax=Pristionchus pacificus TaxID=54126 RepID=A0A2A6C2V8_PRIPA|nr:hypothetical protein PRIPAC_78246 [Pristionchus pacificus]|eukprot:PDM72373.1 G protein-coupled receptor [Pristionchus pacificus]
MKIQTIADLAAALSILTTLQRTIPCEWSFVFISYGPCSVWGGSACFSLYVMMITAYNVSFTNVMVCMGARYWFLRFGSISRTRIIVPCILRTLLTRIDDSEAERMLHRHFNYSTEYLIVTGTNNMQTTSMFIGCSCTFFAPFPVMLCIWIYRAKMLSLLNEKKRNMSTSTRLLHQQFVASNEMPAFFSPIIVITRVGHYKKLDSPCTHIDPVVVVLGEVVEAVDVDVIEVAVVEIVLVMHKMVVVDGPPVVVIVEVEVDGATQAPINISVIFPGHGNGRPLSAPTRIHAPVVALNASATHLNGLSY